MADPEIERSRGRQRDGVYTERNQNGTITVYRVEGGSRTDVGTYEDEREARQWYERAQRDGNGDGYDDETGEDYGEAAAWSQEARGSRDEARAYQQRIRDMGGAGGGRGGYDPRGGGYSGGGGSGSGGGDPNAGVHDVDRALGGTVIGGITGSDARSEMAREDFYRAQQRADASYLLNYIPSAEELAVDYEAPEMGELGPESSQQAQAEADPFWQRQQRDAAYALQDIYRSGGLTDADRARMQLGQDEVGRWMRSQREADQAQLQARGMGGSGASLASMLSAQQGGASAISQREAQMQIEAQRRALEAMQASGQLSSTARGQSFEESSTRGAAADRLNSEIMGYRRQREGERAQAANATRESRSQARQQAYQNREGVSAMLTGQYGGQAAARGGAADRAQRDQESGLGLIGGILSNL